MRIVMSVRLPFGEWGRRNNDISIVCAGLLSYKVNDWMRGPGQLLTSNNDVQLIGPTDLD